ncbi:MAG: GIY-YIG nuclease family protein [Gemmataceae bacterium]
MQNTLSSNTPPVVPDSHAPAPTGPSHSRDDNSLLYDAGQRYSRMRAGMSRPALTPKQLAQSVANRVGQSVSEVGIAIAFYMAVRSVCRVAGQEAGKLILRGSNPLLTPRTVIELADRKPEIIRAAIERASEELHPFARSVPENTQPELIRWDNDLDRLRQAEQLLVTHPTEGEGSARRSRPDPKLFGDAVALRAAVRAVALELGTLPRMRAPKTNPIPTTVSVAKARRLVEGVTRDLPLVAAMYPPTSFARATLATTVARIAAVTERIISIVAPSTSTSRSPAKLDERSVGPGTEGGTYAVVMESGNHPGLRIGRLGTFRLPAGFLVYVGSAFGGGGVADRTSRHRNPDSLRRWNIDHLKAIAHPVELWWTHNNQKKPVECSWAMTLANFPGYCCPAPRCGGNDCKRCPAHLFHVATRPRCEDFVTAVRGSVPRHGPVYRQQLDSESPSE